MFLSIFLAISLAVTFAFLGAFAGLVDTLFFPMVVLAGLVVVLATTDFCDFFAFAEEVVAFVTVFFLAVVFDEFSFPDWALSVEDFVFVVVLLVLGMRVSVILV